MSSYNSKFVYRGFDSKENNMVITHFVADDSETDTFLSMDSVYTDNYDGTYRNDYGAKYNSVATINITLVNKDCGLFTTSQFRNIAKSVTGARKSSWLDIYNYDPDGNDVLVYSFLCKCTNLQQYKMDARVIGIVLEFTSVSPWAFSPTQTISNTISGSQEITISNKSDDKYTYIYPQIIFNNENGTELKIENTTTSETSDIVNLTSNEIVTIYNNHIIMSDKQSKTFGDDFNFIWPRFVSGDNVLNITCDGTITMSYRYPMKVGDGIVDIDASSFNDLSDNIGSAESEFISKLNSAIDSVLNT